MSTLCRLRTGSLNREHLLSCSPRLIYQHMYNTCHATIIREIPAHRKYLTFLQPRSIFFLLICSNSRCLVFRKEQKHYSLNDMTQTKQPATINPQRQITLQMISLVVIVFYLGHLYKPNIWDYKWKFDCPLEDFKQIRKRLRWKFRRGISDNNTFTL